MARTKQLGDIAEAAVMADVLRRGYRVALPYGEDWPFDLLVLRDATFERVQVKFCRSDGSTMLVSCASANNWQTIKYTKAMIDWIAAYDATTGACYYIPAEHLGDGKRGLRLRLGPTRNNQARGIRWAASYSDW